MMMKKGLKMWDDFTDFELAELAFLYGLQDEVHASTWNFNLTLRNRPELERILTKYEYDAAFSQKSLAFNSESTYNSTIEEGNLQ
jgi:hypothetical protein